MDTELNWKTPPLIFEDAQMCVLLRNNLYVYNDNPFKVAMRTNSPATSSITSFNDEELSRGVYLYSNAVNCWFPVPIMKRKMEQSCLVSCDDVLFLVGGLAADNLNSAGYAQAYDCRVANGESSQKLLVITKVQPVALSKERFTFAVDFFLTKLQLKGMIL
jgi:hypothetical protein